jgi:transposase-like protein
LHAIIVKIREGQIASRPVYLAPGGTVDGERVAVANHVGRSELMSIGLIAG